jgi:hypothetical protein
MRAAAWMVGGSLASWLAVVVIVGLHAGADVLLGMLAPLVATTGSWVLTERMWRHDPARVTAFMVGAFGAKAVFFGAYVAVMIKGAGVRPVPFVSGFTGYFIGLYLVEALLLRRLFAAPAPHS